MSTTIDPTGLGLSSIFAPMYWGCVMSLVLGGISIVQGYIFFQKTNDRLNLKIIAGVMLILDFASSALVAQSVYYYLIPHFGSLLPLNSITPELSADCLISTIITFISQLYFVKQLYVVIDSRKCAWFVGAIGFLSVLAFAFGVACTCAMIVHKHAVLGHRSNIFQIFFGLAKGFGAITDILATVAMCAFLASSRTGLNQSLMQFILNRGALVTLIQTLLLIIFFAVPGRLYWLAFHVNVTKLYVNTFFAMLNARSHLNQKHSVVTASGSHSYSEREVTFGTPRKPQFSNTDPFFCGGEVEDNDNGKTMPMAPMPTVTRTVVISNI